MNPILNITKSKDDNRDWIFDDICSLNTLPTKCDLRNDLLPVRNQGSQGTEEEGGGGRTSNVQGEEF